jgi:DNA-binding transcriptional regulator GbsR (MarR family)
MASKTDEINLNENLIVNSSPSIQRIYELLLINEKMTIKDIKDRTHYSRRTISFALRQLIKANLVRRIPKLLDMRRYHYTISEK